MKKITSSFTAVGTGVSLLFMTAGAVFAQGAEGQEICQAAGTNFSALCRLRLESDGGGIMGGALQVLLIIAILVALFFLLYGGLKWSSSGGDRGKIEQARSTLIAAVVGLVIALSAFFIVNFVLYWITGQSSTSFKVPRLID